MNTEKVTIGFDPGLATTGYGVIRGCSNNWDVIACGVIRTAQSATHQQRLLEIYRETRSLIERFDPAGVAVEEVFMAKNRRTAMFTAETRGVILLAAWGVPVQEYTPLQMKKRITGYGRASKEQIQTMVKQILGLSKVPRPDDAADGLALALCCQFDLRKGIINGMHKGL
jgi:crossover junction endodeoxyribonuclease RuvC